MKTYSIIHKLGVITISMILSATIGCSGEVFKNLLGGSIDRIEVTPANGTIHHGMSTQFQATAIYTNNTRKDITAEAVWDTSDIMIATVTAGGMVKGEDLGTATISATFEGTTGSTEVTIDAEILMSIAVEPTNPSSAEGTYRQFTATGTFSDLSTQDITTSVTWSSSDDGIATISNTSGTQGRAMAVVPGTVTITATSGTISGSTQFTVTAATLVSIAVTPTNPTTVKGLTRQFTATGTYDNATTQDLTDQVSWSSSNESIATISNAAGDEGLATAVDPGTVTITATSGVIFGTTQLTVNAPSLVSISVTPTNPTTVKGLTRQFTATGTYDNATTQDLTDSPTLTWSSSDNLIATISNTTGTDGLATAVDPGTVTITATSGSISGNTQFTVSAPTLLSISVTPSNPTTVKGLTRQFTATGTYNNATTQDLTDSVLWESSNSAIAVISNATGTEGVATAVDPGTVTITATSGSVSGNTQFTVTAPTLVSISVTPTNPTTVKGLTRQFTATGTYDNTTTQDLTDTVVWNSSNTSFATISNAAGSHGLATAVDPGTVTITATSGSVSGNTQFTVTAPTLVSISVTPTNPTTVKGLTRQFTATGTYDNATTQDLTDTVVWNSSNTSFATISNAAGSHGLATAVDPGTVTITATSGSVSGNTQFTVTAPTLMSISVTPAHISLPVNKWQQYTATGTYDNGTTQDLTSSVTWSSSMTNQAEISNDAGSRGVATTKAAGSTTITATLGSVYGNTTLTVTAATLVSITVTPVNPSLATGMNLQFQATGIYSDNSTHDITASVTWSSSAPARATISSAPGSQGLASGVSAGTTTITATDTSTMIAGSTLLTVTPATLIAVTVTPVNVTIANGTAQQFTAIGTFDDSTTQDITTQVTWTSSDETKAVISNAAGSQGYASSVAVGATTISATHSGLSGNTTLTVSNATLQSITITPNNPICYGTNQQFTATGNYWDGVKNTTQDITASVTWSSSVTGVATISNAPGSNGLAVSKSVGATIIKAELDAVSNTTILEVRAITLVSLTISPANPTVVLPGTILFTVAGTYNDGTVQDLTTQVLWTSSDETKAVISNAAGSQGVASSVATGVTTISAIRDSITGTTELTVDVDDIAPVMSAATLIDSTKVQVTFSEPVNITQAKNASSYKITASASGVCTDNSNFDGSSQTPDFSITSVTVLSPTDYVLNLSSGMQNMNYTVLADKDEIRDLAALPNFLGCPNNKDFAGLDITLPRVSSAESNNSTTVRVTFSENVNESEAENKTNYKIVNAPAVGNCSDNSNFTSSTKTSDFDIVSVTGSGKVYDITLSATQISGKSYTVLVNKDGIHDMAATPNLLGCPNNQDFIGLEQLKVSRADSKTLTSFIVTFSKAVKAGVDIAGSAGCSNTTECAKRYYTPDASSLGQITKATILDGSVCNGEAADPTKVCVEHTLNQGGASYTIIVANNVDGDNFNNTSWGSIRDSKDTENVQISPKDRASFNGSGTTPQNFTDGPIATNPFGDDSAFGYLATYSSQIYIGPNTKGNAARRFNPDGSSPEDVFFEIAKDTTGGFSQNFGPPIGTVYLGASNNSAATRDGGIAVPPYVTIGYTGCTPNIANISGGCGPNNEDGRGLFTSGIIGGVEHLFITGGRSAGFNNYMYWTTETNTSPDYKYIDLVNPFRYTTGGSWVAGNKGTESIKIFNDKIYWMSPGDRTYRPYLMKVINKTAESANDTDSKFMMMTWMPGIGYLANTNPNKADMVGGTMFTFNNRLYIANSGSISDSSSCDTGTSYSAGVCEQTGGIVRSINNDPGHCTATGTCADWANITPSTNDKYRMYFTNVLTKLADLIPADQPIPGFADFNGNLYMIRNACTTSRWNRSCIGAPCSDDTACSDAQSVPQLWKCDPTNGGLDTTNPSTCESNEWSLIAENGSTGKTNMGSTNNTKITFIAKNGLRLYIGFDNATNGVTVWRTKSGVTNPSLESEFEQIGGNGLGNANNLQIFSSVSLQQGLVHYLYLSVGKSGVPVKVYRQQNN